jgi:GNAT superfamily N-acetyltransferase
MPHALPRPAAAGAGIVRAAGPADLPYVVHLQKRNTDALGFLPRAALAEKIGRGQIWLSLENGRPAGFLHHGSLAVPEVRIFQAAVQYDARRRQLGLALVQDLADRAADAGARGLSLRCLSFLEANDFWRAAGFTQLDTEPGAKGPLNVWAKQLAAARLQSGFVRGHMDRGVNFAFHSRLHPCPACGRPTFDTWTRGAVRRRVCRECLMREGGNRS